MKQTLSAWNSTQGFPQFFTLRLAGRQHRHLALAKWSCEQRRWQDRTKAPINNTDSGMCCVLYSISSSSHSLSLSFFFLSYHQGCSYPPLIAHGRYIQKSSYIFQPKEATYECDEGYTLVGEATLSCSNSRWSAPAPRCKGNSSPWLGGWNGIGGIENKVSF